MIDNFEKIKSLICFNSPDDFYFMQILKRRKENPNLHSNSYVVKTYFFKKMEEFDFYRDEIINLCEFHNARAYINLNKRSFEKVGFKMLSELSDKIYNKDYKGIRKLYNSVVGKYSSDKNKKWIIDIDEKNLELNKEIIDYINNIHPSDNRYIDTIETKNGYHLIVKPFNPQSFKQDFAIEFHKDNPTILYIP